MAKADQLADLEREIRGLKLKRIKVEKKINHAKPGATLHSLKLKLSTLNAQIKYLEKIRARMEKSMGLGKK